MGTSQQQLLGLWIREFLLEGYLLPHYQILIGATLMTERHKMILKPEILIMSRVISEKHSNRDGNAQKSSIIKWK